MTDISPLMRLILIHYAQAASSEMCMQSKGNCEMNLPTLHMEEDEKSSVRQME